MNERLKTAFELASEMLLNSKPSELLKERGKESPSLDDQIKSEIDVPRVRSMEKQSLSRTNSRGRS